MQRMVIFKKAKGRPGRYAVKLFTKMVPLEVLLEWKGVANYTIGEGYAAIP